MRRLRQPRRRRMYESRKADIHLDKLEDIVRRASSYKNIGDKLTRAGYNYEYRSAYTFNNMEVMPTYYIYDADGFDFILIHKRYERNADRVIYDIAIKQL